MDRRALIRRRTQKRLSESWLARNGGEPLDEIHFCYRRRGQFVRQRAGRGFAGNIARSARIACRSAKVRSLSKCRSWDNESVSAWRGVRVERWSGDRYRPWTLRALHQLRAFAPLQSDKRPG